MKQPRVLGFNNRKWLKKVQQELSIIEKNLPDMIYGQVYEDRMDLLRDVILGENLKWIVNSQIT